jgi:uncharacterized lipoprotein YddW (UPF0748 family)
MNKKLMILFLLSISTIAAFSQQQRGTWLSRNSLESKALLASQMDSLATNNFNVVYVNLWSRGYPLWKSDVFFSHTGLYIDPTYNGRDILAEAIAEGHRNGLKVVAWFEYGFVGGWTGNMPPGQKGPIFNTHPTWVAKKKDGTEMDGSNFYWMIHTLIDAQNFLIAMTAEIARNYDVDGIQLDRIRYSSKEYGYDSVTVNLYKSEHGGASPPTNTSTASWIRWRADKLNDFVARFYDSIKTINPYLQISNAPGHYSSTAYQAYNDYCQDWIWWVDNNKVDDIQLQIYVSSPDTFGNRLNYINSNVTNKSKVYPSFAIKPGGTSISDASLLQFFQITAQKGFNGNTIWFYDDLVPRFSFIRSNVYTSKTSLPYSTPDWREYKLITPISDISNAVRTGNWLSSSLQGYSGNSIYCANSTPSSIDYYFDVPKSAFYELYAFNVVSTNRTIDAFYDVKHSTGNQNVFVDQSDANKTRWIKLGDFYFTKGRKNLVQLSNSNLPADKFLSADAMFLSLNRRLSPIELQTSIQLTCIPEGFYDPATDKLSQKDTVLVYLANNFSPYVILDSAKEVIDSITFSGNFLFKEAPSGNFYFILKHRNSIETWSKAGGESIVKGSSGSYNFTLSSSAAYGSNMTQRGTRWCIYSGDINQDGIVDSTDFILTVSDSFLYKSGYLITDLSGDKFIDIEDCVLVDNNLFRRIQKVVP